MWLTKVDRDKWRWLSMILPYLVLHDDLGLKPRPSMQMESDLELKTLPQYVCKVPSVLFFPYITCVVEDWFGGGFGPHFVIPQIPLNRLKGRYWLDSLASRQLELIRQDQTGFRHGWINPDGSPYSEGEWPLEYLELKRLATAAKSFLLDEIRYVYDESKRSRDSRKTNTPTRHCFSENVANFDITKEYLNWYIERFNVLFDKLLAIGQESDQEKREKCLVAGWTINRIAVDIITISVIDVPYIRKWQFFGLLDAVAALKNEFDGTGHKGSKDRDTAQEMLEKPFLQQFLEPTLGRIPVRAIRDQVLAHTRAQYDAVDQMRTDDQTGPKLLWLYRNSRHGYTLRDTNKRRQVLEHCGTIPNDLPDLAIALWHYVLLKFPEL